ncbi:MAG TPA: ATP-dependent DNA helicase [Bacillales bacterium]|nr:ATP-dependent DNA helicase [Bacillales bacterium]
MILVMHVTTIRESVRSLVEYVHRSGSIDSRFRAASSLTEGTRAHQRVQKTYAEADLKEVYLQTELTYEEFVFSVDGRADGILFEGEDVVIDEIKSKAGTLEDIEEDSYPVHWAQAQFYAYMYAGENDRSEMIVQLTYVHTESDERRTFRKTFSFAALSEFVMEMVKGYAPFAMLVHELKEKRRESIVDLPFPFEAYRKGQRKFAGAVYRTIDEEKNLFANAPTGTGKTVSTVFPAVKAMGEGKAERLFYLTAKSTTKENAEETLALLEAKGLCMRSTTITAKQKVCFKEETICTKEHCEFADGYYDRINDAVSDILENETRMTRDVIERYARKHTVCPFEFSLDLSYAADAVICDYNYLFDPRVSLNRLYEEEKRRTVLLIDEAHNLVDRAREMFSASLRKADFLAVKREFRGDVREAAKAVNDHLLFMKKQHAGESVKELDEELVSLLDGFIAAAEKELLKQNGDALLLDVYFAAHGFVKVAKLYDERYVTYVEAERSDVHVKLFCLDPSHLLQKAGKNYRAKVYFSATLVPAGYYTDMLGGDADDYFIEIPSPFPPENVQVYVLPHSTRFRDREQTLPAIVQSIHELTERHPGNHLVFFPSYHYLYNVYDAFSEAYPDVSTLVQDPNMSEADRDEFLSKFQSQKAETLIGFAVLGGVFSEGVDLKGDRLNGVFVVGVGLPQIGLERDIIKSHFQQEGKNGYDYAYVFPGMTKVLQAGGRLIRSEDDHGIVVLIDDRFLQRKYQSLLPPEWRDFTVLR